MPSSRAKNEHRAGSIRSCRQAAGCLGLRSATRQCGDAYQHMGVPLVCHVPRPASGILASPNWLLYVTGGLAIGGTKYSFTFSQPGAALNNPPTPTNYALASRTTSVGFTLGAGTEYRIDRNWSMKFEYLYVDLGTVHDQHARYRQPAVQRRLPCARSHRADRPELPLRSRSGRRALLGHDPESGYRFSEKDHAQSKEIPTSLIQRS